MKKILLLLNILVSFSVYSQTDNNGNPVFNSQQIEEIAMGRNYKLILNYYTLEYNIENPLSSVFISKNPSKEEVIDAATNLISYNFLLLKEQNIVDLIVLNETPQREYNVINQATGKSRIIESQIKGIISENRANEILEKKFDEETKIENDKLFFNGNTYLIYSKEILIKEIKKIIDKQELLKDKVSEVLIPTKKQLEKYIIEETKQGRQLDFFTEIKGKEYNAIQIKPKIIVTLEGIAFYKWGRANYELGVNTYQDAINTYSKIVGRELNEKEKTYIKSGFYKKWEQ